MRCEAVNHDIKLICVCTHAGSHGAELCRLGCCAGGPTALRQLDRGERIRANGSRHTRFRIVRRGLVANCAMTPDGRRQLLCLNLPGDAVCSMAPEGAESWCEALAPSEICELDFADDFEQLRSDPIFTGALFRLVHDRLDRSVAQLVALGRLDGMERVCGFLADLARRTGRPGRNGWQVALPMSREDIADYLGLNADTVSRILTRIKKAGLARFPTPSSYEVPSIELLEARVPIGLGRQSATPDIRGALA